MIPHANMTKMGFTFHCLVAKKAAIKRTMLRINKGRLTDGDPKFSLFINLKSASNLNGNLNCSKELEHYAS